MSNYENQNVGTTLPSGSATAANQTTQITAEQAIQATLGATTGAAVVTDANGTIQQYLRGLVKRWVDALGGGTKAAALRITQSTDDAGEVALTNFGAGEYETVAASQTAQVLGGSGAIGDYISGLLVIPATLNPGNVILLDNAISITVFAGGTGSVSNLIPFFIPLGLKSVSGALKVTTGADVSILAIGNFS